MKTFLLLFFLLASPNGHAVLNKWIDSEGRVHYSDLPPPPEVKATKLRGTATSGESSPGQNGADAENTESQTIAEREAELKKAQQDKKAAEEKAAKDLAYAESLKESCTAARKNLMILKDGRRIAELDDKGETVYMEDDQRQKNIQKTEQDIAKYCK
jgi:hypothetical protein